MVFGCHADANLMEEGNHTPKEVPSPAALVCVGASLGDRLHNALRGVLGDLTAERWSEANRRQIAAWLRLIDGHVVGIEKKMRE